MDLVSGSPFWPIAAGIPASYPPLGGDQIGQVAIIGAGITGALAAEALSREGVEVILLDRREVATGSTAASTALLSYELDVELQELTGQVGKHAAVRAYQLSLEAIDTIARLSAEPGDDCGFAQRQSLYLASSDTDLSRLEAEAELRAACGLPAEFWDRTRVASNYELKAPGAIRSSQAAEVDPYRLTHKLLARTASRGARIFDRTEVTGYERRGKSLLLRTDRDATVQAERVVFALGYEVPPQLRKDIVELSSTYAVITEPVASFPGWDDRCLVWETARPYRYLRSTSDNRVIIGGLDEPFRNAALRDRLLPHKAAGLGKQLGAMLPSLTFESAYAWTGTFGATRDGMAYVGEAPEFPGGIFALGYGGNGITFGVVAARLIVDLCLGRSNPDIGIFRLDR